LDDKARVTDRVTEAVNRALRLVGPAERATERVAEDEIPEDALSS
jgi:hypothetical protein